MLKNIGQRLRELRGAKTMQQVSDDTGIKRTTLQMYECGKRVPRDEIKLVLSDYYGVSVEDIFFTRDDT